MSREVLAGVPAFQASIPFVVGSHALTRAATYFRRFAPPPSLEAPGWTGLSRVSRDLQ